MSLKKIGLFLARIGEYKVLDSAQGTGQETLRFSYSLQKDKILSRFWDKDNSKFMPPLL